MLEVTWKEENRVICVESWTERWVANSKKTRGPFHEYWYYDIIDWKRNVNGEHNEELTQPVSKRQKAWIEEYYLPKLTTKTQ